MKRKNIQKPPTKVVVTNPKEAIAILKTYITESGNTIKVAGSRKPHTTVMMIVKYFLANYNQAINPGWLGRTLQYAANNNMGVTPVNISIDGNTRTVYRLGK